MLWHRQAIFQLKGDKLSSSAECRIRVRVFVTKSPADRMPADKPTELSRSKLKTWTQQPVPMISKHSANSTPLPFGSRTWLWRYTCLLWLISMLWQKQAILKLKGDKLFSSAGCRIWNWVFGTESPADCMPADKPTELSRIKLKTWTQQPVHMISEHSAHSTPLPFGFHTWLSALYMFVIVNFDFLAQTSDFHIESRQVIFLCWMQDLNQGLRDRISSRLNARRQTDWAIEDQAKCMYSTARPEISEHSAHTTPLPFGFRTWLWWHTCLLLLIPMLWHRQAIFKLKRDNLSSCAECRIWIRVFRTKSPTDWMPADKPTELSRFKLKTLTQQPALRLASIQLTRPHCHLAFAPGSGDIHVCWC